MLLGAHLGSFEAMRAMATDKSLPLNIVGYFKNARLINGVLEKLNPGLAARVINVERNMNFVLTLKERIDAGEMVAAARRSRSASAIASSRSSCSARPR